MSERKRKGFWRSLGRRDPSMRHSLIETSSQCSLDNSSDDLRSSRRSPVSPTSGSLDRLTALNAKPPKPGFFTLKAKTPAFWKPLFQHSTFVSSAPIIHTDNTPVRHQLVQTDSPTKAATSDFGVQAVMSERSTHTRDVLVQTCPAWDESLGQTVILPVAVVDPNAVTGRRGSVEREVRDESAAAKKQPFPEFEKIVEKTPKVPFDVKCSECSSQEEAISHDSSHTLTNGKFALCDSILNSLKEESSDTLKKRKMAECALMNTKPDFEDVEWKMLCEAFPEIQSDFLDQHDDQSSTVHSDSSMKPIEEKPVIWKNDRNSSSLLSGLKFQFDELRNDFEISPVVPPDFPSDGPKTMENAATNTHSDVLCADGSADAASLNKNETIDDQPAPQARDSLENMNSRESVSIPVSNSEEMSMSVSFKDNVTTSSQCSANVAAETAVTPSKDNTVAVDQIGMLSSCSPNSLISGVDALMDQSAKRFESCENLEQLEDEIIRSLYSPLPEYDINQCESLSGDTKGKAVERTREICGQPQSPNRDKCSDEMLQTFSENIEGVKPKIIVDTSKTRNKPSCEPNSNKNWKMLNAPLENITEESATDDDSNSQNDFKPSSCDKEETNSSVVNSNEKSDVLTSEFYPEEPANNSTTITSSPGFTSVNEISEVIVQLPPRKAKICVNVFELSRISRIASDPVAPDETKTADPKTPDSTDAGMSYDTRREPSETQNSRVELNRQGLVNERTTPTTSPTLPEVEDSKSNSLLIPVAVTSDQRDSSASPETKHVSQSYIVLKTAQKDPEVTSPSDVFTDSKSEQSPPPPPPPPPPPTAVSQKSVSAHSLPDTNINNDPLNSGSPKFVRNNILSSINKSNNPSKSPMMAELEQRFLTRQKMADDLECITKKIAMNAQKECGGLITNKDNDLPANRNNTGFQNLNGLHNGHGFSQQPSAKSCNSTPLSYSHVTNGDTQQNFAGHAVITDQPPPPGAVLIDEKVTVNGDKIHRDKYYAIPVKEVLKEKSSTTKFIPAPPKHEGIGPTEEGVPLSLRQSVKKENMSDWYKTMYKTLHKIDNEGDTYVIGYMSDPESKREEKRTPKKLDIRSDQPKHEGATNGNIVLHGYPPSAKSTVNTFTSQPRPIADYEPGYSSLVDNQPNTVLKRHFPTLNQTKPSYEIKDGFESETYVLKRNLCNEPDVEKQKTWYKQVQQGGDIPQFGLGKAAPEKPQEPVVGPPPPLPVNPYQQNQYQKASRPLTLPPDNSNITDNNISQCNGLYANQMRQAIHSELQQKGYQISPQSNNKTVRKVPLEKRLFARVLYNFTAESPREISLKKDDTVVIYRELDKNWYEGEHNASIGIFPISYVEILPPEHTSPQPPKVQEGFGKVLYDFAAHASVELQARKGDEVRLIRKVDDNWYEGRISGRKGIIPCSYVTVIEEPGAFSIQKQNISQSPKNMSSPRLLDASNSSVSTTPLSSPSVASRVTNSPQNGYKTRSKKGSRLIEPVLYKALYRYSPQNADELELIEGDTVYVVEMCDDGWYVGTSVRTGELGIIPGNYMEKA